MIVAIIVGARLAAPNAIRHNGNPMYPVFGYAPAIASTLASARPAPAKSRASSTSRKVAAQAIENAAMNPGWSSCSALALAMMSNSSAGSASQTTKRFNSEEAAGPNTPPRRRANPIDISANTGNRIPNVDPIAHSAAAPAHPR